MISRPIGRPLIKKKNKQHKKNKQTPMPLLLLPSSKCKNRVLVLVLVLYDRSIRRTRLVGWLVGKCRRAAWGLDILYYNRIIIIHAACWNKSSIDNIYIDISMLCCFVLNILFCFVTLFYTIRTYVRTYVWIEWINQMEIILASVSHHVLYSTVQ